jgi:O-antigen/teichoic acid export membrane protein
MAAGGARRGVGWPSKGRGISAPVIPAADEAERQRPVRASVRAVASKGREVGSAMVFEIVQLVSLAVIFPIVARSFGPDNYGQYSTLYVIAGSAITWTSASVGAAMVQLSLQHRRTSSSLLHAGRRQVVLSIVPTAVIGCGVSLLLFGPEILVPALLVFGGDLLFGGIANVQIALLYAERGIGPSTRVRALGPAVKAACVFGLSLVDGVTIVNVVLSNSIAAVVMLAVSSYMIRSIPKPRVDDGRQASGPREVFRYSGLYATTISANTVQDSGENVVLAAVRPAAEVGEYQAAYRLVELALTPMRALANASIRWFLVPDDGRSAQVRRSLKISTPVAVYGLACIAAFSVLGPLVTFIIGDQFTEAARIMVWLSGFPLLKGLADIPVMGLLGLDENKPRMWLGLGGAAFALVCYIVLVPMMGWQGAVLGTYLSEIATLIAGWVVLLVYQRRHDAALVDEFTFVQDPTDQT